MRRAWLAILLLAFGVSARAEYIATDPAVPEPIPSPITDHFAFSGEFFLGHVTTIGRFDAGNGTPGTTLNGERDLGLSDQARQLRMEIVFRLVKRGRLRVNFLDLRRQGERSLDQTIQYGDQTFRVGSLVQSQFNWRQMDLTYTYSLLRGESYELGAGVGVHLIEAEASAQIPSTPQSADYSVAGPFATVALDGTWRFASHWALSARGQYLRVTIGSVSGMMGDYHADVQYRWKRNVAFGLGYELQEMEADVTNQDPSGRLQLRIAGPLAFARVSF
jgi:hypothetical protein